MNVPANLKYSNDHEWCRVEGGEAFIGITDFAQSQFCLLYTSLLVSEGLNRLVDMPGVIHAEAEVHRRVMHQIDLDTVSLQQGEDRREFLFEHEGKVPRTDRQQYLILLQDQNRNLDRRRHTANHRARFSLVPERPHVERDVLVLQRFDRLGMDDLCPAVSQLDGVQVVQFRDLHRIGENLRVGIQDVYKRQVSCCSVRPGKLTGKWFRSTTCVDDARTPGLYVYFYPDGGFLYQMAYADGATGAWRIEGDTVILWSPDFSIVLDLSLIHI